MPSPFPGMDPYLEGPGWMAVHSQLLGEMGRQLAPRLPARYLVRATERNITETRGNIPHTTLEIRDVHDRRVVTAIELLSPTNKSGDGREEYLNKRRQILLSQTHLLEIDLLRRGQRVPMRQPLPGAPYFICLSRVQMRPTLEVWPVTLDQPLPVVPVPLLPGDADVPLDLQAALTAMYDTYRYDQEIDYRLPPAIALEAPLQMWAQERLRAQGRI